MIAEKTQLDVSFRSLSWVPSISLTAEPRGLDWLDAIGWVHRKWPDSRQSCSDKKVALAHAVGGPGKRPRARSRPRKRGKLQGWSATCPLL